MGDENKQISVQECDGIASDVEMSAGDHIDSGPTKYVGIVDGPADSEQYNMRNKHRGLCLIFNNMKFEPHTKLNERRGTDVDATKLHQRFRELDFDVKVLKDYSKKKILDTLKEVAKLDHSSNDCFACVLLTHGDTGVLFGCDGKFATSDIFEPFLGDKCLSLAGKPKLFFLQACQGDRLDSGTTLLCNDSTDYYHSYKIPAYADFLIAYSTIPGFFSWRNTTEGSWFVQAVCKVLEKYGRQKDLLSMLTIVNRIVAFEFESCVPTDMSMNKKKQIPCISSMLTREVYFPSKK